jgi:m7GpppX diphosphatase
MHGSTVPTLNSEDGTCIKKKMMDTGDEKVSVEQPKPIVSINQHESIDLKSIKFERVLRAPNDTRPMFVLGSIKDEQVVVGFERAALSESAAQLLLTSDHVQVKRDFVNDIYGTYFANLDDSTLNRLKCTVIHPATDKHVAKYSFVPTVVLVERAVDYEQITLPYIQSSQLSIDWVFNILEHRQEVERIVLEDDHPDNGFVLLPDLKWDTSNLQALYLMAIVHPRNIKSLRDLRSKHLPLLRNIRDKSLALIKEKWSVDSDRIRAYLHYQPSYYHLHVHFTHIQYDSSIATCTRSHLLDTVISNLEVCPDYYSKVTLPFEVREGNALHKLFLAQTEPAE